MQNQEYANMWHLIICRWNRFIWNLICCLFSADQELYKTNIITLQLSCVYFFLTSSEKHEDAGMYKGFPLLHLLPCTFPSTLVHPSLALCFLLSLETRSDKKNSLSKEIFMIDDSFCCPSSKPKGLVSVDRRKNTIISLEETCKVLALFQHRYYFRLVSVGRNRTVAILPQDNEEKEIEKGNLW